MTRPKIRRHALFAFSLSLMLLTGCSGLFGGQSEPLRYYVLSEAPKTESPKMPPGPESQAILAVFDVTMSNYLDTRSIVTRTAENNVNLASFDQWAAPFVTHVSRTLKNNLAILIPSNRVILTPLSIPVAIDYELRTDIQQFEREPSGDVVLSARWALIDMKGNNLVALEGFEVRKPVAIPEPTEETTNSERARLEYSAIAAAMSEALADLSREIATVTRNYARTRKRS
jgi:uncharacterized lipoprotein YmbA